MTQIPNKPQKAFVLTFINQDLLAQAFTHRSYLNEAKARHLESNERLEFLGDAVLSFVISQWLYEKFPHYPEGKLTNLRSLLVKTDTLAQIGLELNLGSQLLLSKGEKNSGGQANPSLLANTLEAVVGALYLDQGIDQVRSFIHLHFNNYLLQFVTTGELKDAKSLLQEKLQSRHQTPHYQTLKAEGPDHAKTFTIGVYINKVRVSVGHGKSKQTAQEAAAKLALEKLALKK